MSPIVSFKKASKEYMVGTHVVKAVHEVSFDIEQGEFVVILGPSGAGKSTILNLLGGMESVTTGEIIVNGQNISGYSDDALTEYRATNIGFVFQFYNLIPTLTALENIALTGDIVKNAVDPNKVLESVGLKDQANQFPGQLSGGEQQRVSIARAVAKNPTLLLCDEPTGALDSQTGTTILSMLRDLTRPSSPTGEQDAKTVIVVTHNAALAEAADRVIRLKNGRIREIIQNPTPIDINEVVW